MAKHVTTASLLAFISVIALSYFPIIHGLSDYPIHMWDEATYANNAIDMAYVNNNYVVVQHQGAPDLYNTKPPFVIWMQAISIKAFGVNEFAVRLPSAIFALLTVVLVYLFCVRNLNSKLIGFMASAILVSSQGYVSIHIVRSGDLDATLIFWLTLGVVTFIDLLLRKPTNTWRHFALLALSVSLGFLTKGAMAFAFVPFMFIISLFKNNRFIYRDYKLYLAIIFVLFTTTMYLILRVNAGPNYWDALLNETFRLKGNATTFYQPFNYYYKILAANHFYIFFYFLPLLLITPIVNEDKKRRISIYLLIVALGYFLLISYMDVKFDWYTAPLFPLLAILLGLATVEFATWIHNKLSTTCKRIYVNAALIVGLAVFLFIPYRATLINITYNEHAIHPMVFDGAYLRHLKTSGINLNNLKVLKAVETQEHYDQILFYIRGYNLQNGWQITMSDQINFDAGDLVMCSQKNLKENLLNAYDIEIVNTWKNGSLYSIKQAKPTGQL